MTPTVMVTDGGPHPADKWAEVTAGQLGDLIVLGPNASPKVRREKEKFVISLQEAFEGHHQDVQDNEAAALKKEGTARLSTGYREHVEKRKAAALKSVADAAKGTSFESHFARPEIQEIVWRMISQHFTSSMKIHRSWHADANPDDKHAKAFKARRIESPIGGLAPATK
ncbi:MAG TPA: hypothetical protein VKT73_13210 [Xanthobacteraceae bacterium]|nr:hypothetical protein [Xanthobacteraceae bacterium]